MANVYKDQQGDARQTEADKPEGLFRKRYKKLTEAEVALHDAIKDKAEELHALFLSISPSMPDPVRDRGANVQLGIRHLEDAVYRAVKGLTA